MNTIKAILLLATIITVPITFSDASAQNTKLFPDWFNNNLKWYLDGTISETELANAFEHLANQNVIFLNPERAKMVQALQDENKQLKQQMKVIPTQKPAPKALPELPKLPDVSCPSGHDWIQCAQVCIPSGDMVCPNGMSINPNTGRCLPHDDQEPCICTKEYMPVCGSDGNTYGNKCEANCAGVDISYDGKCQDKCASNDQCELGTVCRDGLCQQPCEIQCIKYDPVCGEDGNTYACGEADAACHGVDVAHEGECEIVCPKVYDPVCGTDGNTYGNACEAEKANVQIDHEGECEIVCPKVYDPVCGTDGNTYGNACEAEKAGVQIAHEGECKARLSTGDQ